jgi:hypothetical protein
MLSDLPPTVLALHLVSRAAVPGWRQDKQRRSSVRPRRPLARCASGEGLDEYWPSRSPLDFRGSVLRLFPLVIQILASDVGQT